MIADDFLWTMKYRPKTVEECILPASIKNTFQSYVNNKEIPNLLLSGSQGIGKTGVSLAMVNEIGCDSLFINASNESGIDVLRTKITNYASSVSLNGGRKVVILDEFNGTAAFQAAFRAFLEQFSKNCTFILTTNYPQQIIQPIHSRCSVINFSINKTEKKELITQFFKRICWILDNEKVPYDKEAVASFCAKWFPDFRRVINELQRYSTNGKIDAGLLTQIGEIQLKELIKGLKEKDFTKVKTWVVENIEQDYNSIYRKIYDGMYTFLKPQSIPYVVLILGKWQYQTSFVSDPEIQLMACLTEIMVEAEFI